MKNQIFSVCLSLAFKSQLFQFWKSSSRFLRIMHNNRPEVFRRGSTQVGIYCSIFQRDMRLSWSSTKDHQNWPLIYHNDWTHRGSNQDGKDKHSEAEQGKIWTNKLITYFTTFLHILRFLYAAAQPASAMGKPLQNTCLFSNSITPNQFSQTLLLRHKQASFSANFGKFYMF